MGLLSEQAGLEVPDALTDDVASAVLVNGVVEVIGRMPWSSNATFLARSDHGDGAMLAIYKPRAGERPVWDFPDGTLCQREVAACVLSDLLGGSLVPHTVLRDDLPLGPGALQRFIDHDPEEHYFELQADHDDVLRRFAVVKLTPDATVTVGEFGGQFVIQAEGGFSGRHRQSS